MAQFSDAYLQARRFTRKWEGGYCNHRSDPGGPTNKGVTQATYDGFRKSFGLSLQSVRDIAEEEADHIYYRYWGESECGKMPFPVALVHFDSAINFGIWGAAKLLQRTVGVRQDGHIGPVTLKAIQKLDPMSIARAYCEVRIAKRHERVHESLKALVFLKGWLNRDEALKRALKDYAKLGKVV